MAIKKKIAVGLGAVAITAMCFGSTAFAADTPINGTGEAEKNGTTDVQVTYTQPSPTDPAWTVNIPRKIDFGSLTSTSGDQTQELAYSASITNPSSGTKLSALKISLPVIGNGVTLKMKDQTDNYTVNDAFVIQNTGGTLVTPNDTVDSSLIVTLSDKDSAKASAKLKIDSFKNISGITSGVPHAFTGSFTVKITPVKTV